MVLHGHEYQAKSDELVSRRETVEFEGLQISCIYKGLGWEKMRQLGGGKKGNFLTASSELCLSLRKSGWSVRLRVN